MGAAEIIPAAIHLAPVTAAVPTTRLRPWLPTAVHRQLVLPLDDIPPGPTSSGTTWRTWVLPTIPIGLRLLPPEQLASTFVDELLEVAT